jgi:hypothetical protein
VGGELGEQARLADAGLAAQQQRARLAAGRGGQRGFELREFLSAADELRAGDATHGRTIRLRRDHERACGRNHETARLVCPCFASALGQV